MVSLHIKSTATLTVLQTRVFTFQSTVFRFVTPLHFERAPILRIICERACTPNHDAHYYAIQF